MENLNLNPMEVVTAEGSNRKYIAIAKTEGGKLFAALDYEVGPFEDKKLKKTLPAIGITVRFAEEGGGSWGMEARDQGSKLPAGMGNLGKMFFPVALPGPIVYINSAMAQQKVIERLAKWLQSIASANKAELLVTEEMLTMWFEEKSTGGIDYDPVQCEFPNEQWEKKTVAAPVAKAPPAPEPVDEQDQEDEGEDDAEDEGDE
ncbi:hypothetical protein DLP3_039 [Stenotrophomonas phage vB_SmaS_DLP_3]|nr:hypothetical protein DLP3_039 [Stenotrophomonas phage vB_SmaS_DLP_3]